MMNNMIQIHFQHGKRNSFSGAVSCFDNIEYIKMGRVGGDKTLEFQDEIPYTNLNICHKNKASQKRCFVYGYQVTLNV